MLNRKRVRWSTLGVAFGIVIATASCSDDTVGNTPLGTDGFSAMERELQEVIGEVVDPGDGCFALDTGSESMPWIVWPEGTTRPDSDPSAVRLPNGEIVSPGDKIWLTGQETSRAALPDGENNGSMWGSLASFCLGSTPTDAELLILQEAHRRSE
ncbi:hypothetical protein [Leucobacter sp. PH1c]|uniref:hypothetical protein n=1 Tax=Leucobacter sp. PH1c TaxID=1397278 RepID=UPI0012FF08A2|nr:hypothetical protein [Leucobacter sp. PH1c]